MIDSQGEKRTVSVRFHKNTTENERERRWQMGMSLDMSVVASDRGATSALCTMDDTSCFLVIRLGPKTSECEMNVSVKSTGTDCEVYNLLGELISTSSVPMPSIDLSQ